MSHKVEVPTEPADSEQLKNLLNTEDNKENGVAHIQIIPASKINGTNSINGANKNHKESSVEESSGLKVKTGWRRYAGIIFCLGSSICFTLTIIIVKMLSEYHPFCLSVWRFLGILVPAIPMALYFDCWKKQDIYGSVYPWDDRQKRRDFAILMVRGFLTSTMVILRFYALTYLTAADVSVITHTGPVFVTILAHFLLKERAGVVPVLISIFTSLGVVVIMRPPFLTGGAGFDSDMLIGVGLALLSMACTCVVIISVRKQRKIHIALMMLSSGIWGVGESWIFAQSFGVMRLPEGTRDILFMIVLIPVLVFLAQLGIIFSLKFEQAGTVSLLRTCDVIFTFVWQIIFPSVLPDMWSLIGAGIVIVGVIISTLRSMLNNLPEEHGLRRRFRLLLL